MGRGLGPFQQSILDELATWPNGATIRDLAERVDYERSRIYDHYETSTGSRSQVFRAVMALEARGLVILYETQIDTNGEGGWTTGYLVKLPE